MSKGAPLKALRRDLFVRDSVIQWEAGPLGSVPPPGNFPTWGTLEFDSLRRKEIEFHLKVY